MNVECLETPTIDSDKLVKTWGYPFRFYNPKTIQLKNHAILFNNPIHISSL